MDKAPLRYIKFGWAHFTPGGWPASDGTRDERDGSLEVYDELLLVCGHRVLTKPRFFMGKARFTHRCKQCIGATSTSKAFR